MSLSSRNCLIFAICLFVCSTNICFAEFMVCSSELRYSEFDKTCTPPMLTPYEKETNLPRNNPVLQNYITIWESIFKINNKLDDNEFNKLINLFWAYGPYNIYDFHYFVKVDWFHAWCTDQLHTELANYNKQIRTLNLKEPLTVSSAAEAVNKMIESVGQDNISERSKYRCKFDRDGDPVMEVFVVIDRKTDSCNDVEINLRTGNVTNRKTACVRR